MPEAAFRGAVCRLREMAYWPSRPIGLIRLIGLIGPNKPDKPNEPNRTDKPAWPIGSNIDTNVSKIGSWMLRVYD